MIYFLSPHFDDVCFSLGMLAKRNPGATLVNLFTKSKHISAQASLSIKPEHMNTAEISKIRDTEDASFAKTCELSRVNFHLQDTSSSEINPFSLDNIEHEASALDPLLMGYFEKYADKRGTIYCPMAVGNHRNHLSTLLVVLNNFAELSSRFQIFFYEDLPYAANAGMRADAVKRLNTYFNQKVLVRHAHALSDLDLQQKESLLKIYQSQLPLNFNLQDFSPAMEGIKVHHEAYWEVIK